MVQSRHLNEVHLINNDAEGVTLSIAFIQSMLATDQAGALLIAKKRFKELAEKHSPDSVERLSKSVCGKGNTSMTTQVPSSITDKGSNNKYVRRSSSLSRMEKKSVEVRKDTQSDHSPKYSSSRMERSSSVRGRSRDSPSSVKKVYAVMYRFESIKSFHM